MHTRRIYNSYKAPAEPMQLRKLGVHCAILVRIAAQGHTLQSVIFYLCRHRNGSNMQGNPLRCEIHQV